MKKAGNSNVYNACVFLSVIKNLQSGEVISALLLFLNVSLLLYSRMVGATRAGGFNCEVSDLTDFLQEKRFICRPDVVNCIYLFPVYPSLRAKPLACFSLAQSSVV